MNKKTSYSAMTVQEMTTREYCRQIFGYTESPKVVWEKQFDDDDKALVALAGKDWRTIDGHDLASCYLLNLVYVEPLQPELFNYLFPICLAVWQQELMANQQSYFSEEIYRAFARPYLWQQMMNEQQRHEVYQFIVDSFIARLTQERGFIDKQSKTPAYIWFEAFAELVNSLPVIESIWQSWWLLDNPGKAVAALMYASCLIYQPDNNPLFRPWSRELGGGSPTLQWPELDQNRQFLTKVLTSSFIVTKTRQAAELLKHEPEGQLAERIADDVEKNQQWLAISIETMAID